MRRGARLRRVAAVLGVVILALPLLGLVYQSVGSGMDARQYPPPGQRVDVGGYRLHLFCAGSPAAAGDPTIILESGAAGPGLMWALVQPELAAEHRVCAYDRGGLGWSDRSPLPRTSRNMVAELHTLLQSAGVEPPYVLVGHSLGAFNVRVFAGAYRDEVSGLVLINASHEDFLAQLSPGCQKVMQTNTGFARLMQPLATLGVARLAGQLGAFDSLNGELFGDLPESLVNELTALTLYRSQYWATFQAEVAMAGQDCQQAAAAGGLGRLPLVVLAGRPDVSLLAPDLD
jgi:pimeloyl-ACP methyl ester carboxylesterase